MKNRILAAMALCCATSSTMPLWAAEYDDPTIVTVEPNLATDGTGGGKYYIYHVATRKFIAAGNASGTQLSVDSIGQGAWPRHARQDDGCDAHPEVHALPPRGARIERACDPSLRNLGFRARGSSQELLPHGRRPRACGPDDA